MAMRTPENWDRIGMFQLGGRAIFGDLLLDGPKTTLRLHDEERFEARVIDGGNLLGRMNSGRKVTLINCLSAGTGSYGHGGYFADVYPHYVTYGATHLDPAADNISEIIFEFDDATTLFYDFDAFGTLYNAGSLIDKVVEAQIDSMARSFPDIESRTIVTGPDAIILYFTGQRQLLSVDTVLGTVSVSHNPSSTFGGPEGVAIWNRISVSVALRELLTFEHALARLHPLLRFFHLVIGRPQNLLSVALRMNGDADASPLEVYWSSPPKRDDTHDVRKPHPADVLVRPIEQPSVFCDLLRDWLARDDHWQDARERFSTCFANQNVFDIDRLIGSSNMFDILPASAVPADVTLAPELLDAKRKGRDLFRALPDSPERNSVLNALGRVGKSTLKGKIRRRAEPILNALGDQFDDLQSVLDEAVDCRNHYVHGNAPSYDYASNFFETVAFYTDSLEFVFGTSDLMQSGWDMCAWSRRVGQSHRFGAYCDSYKERLAKLHALPRNPKVT
jgi:hypothetical protein